MNSFNKDDHHLHLFCETLAKEFYVSFWGHEYASSVQFIKLFP